MLKPCMVSFQTRVWNFVTQSKSSLQVQMCSSCWMKSECTLQWALCLYCPVDTLALCFTAAIASHSDLTLMIWKLHLQFFSDHGVGMVSLEWEVSSSLKVCIFTWLSVKFGSVCLDFHDTVKAVCGGEVIFSRSFLWIHHTSAGGWGWVEVGAEGGGGDVALKHCVYEAVNQYRLSHASGVKIVHGSGRIIKRATQIVIKSGPRVIIRAWEIGIKGGALGGWGGRLADQQGASRTPPRHRGL